MPHSVEVFCEGAVEPRMVLIPDDVMQLPEVIRIGDVIYQRGSPWGNLGGNPQYFKTTVLVVPSAATEATGP